MDIIPAGSRASKRATEANFTGVVWQDLIANAPAPARVLDMGQTKQRN